jgi:hypothetical protein
MRNRKQIMGLTGYNFCCISGLLFVQSQQPITEFRLTAK